MPLRARRMTTWRARLVGGESDGCRTAAALCCGCAMASAATIGSRSAAGLQPDGYPKIAHRCLSASTSSDAGGRISGDCGRHHAHDSGRSRINETQPMPDCNFDGELLARFAYGEDESGRTPQGPGICFQAARAAKPHWRAEDSAHQRPCTRSESPSCESSSGGERG